ncbi:thioredoxin family protein [Pseudoflavitalea sp. G-6-1-2]|uniref:thioredoxin family protein n=1 Tax=Pseudoflavitalea sp. G-6-1-2 TaxID=2728841 RepID=UPI001469D2F3|nr:thioredoxin family protein [Pseudoflavitalea sp. G-6-1-2]NML23336.1 thioredoxin family protein [Pseudoflavitalea sp. G-6-1-2]
MKKIVWLLLLCFSMLQLLAQDGIQFEHGSWKAVLAKARQENKLVFIDVYTSWCGPCKKMVNEVFPRKDVGEKFNASFINYKLDAEKGEGIDIAKSFDVKAYPTYLFVNGDGELIYRFGGYNEPTAFLKEASVALAEQNSPKPLAKWIAEYESGKRDKEFLLGYLKKRAVVKMPSAAIIEELMPMLSTAELESKEVLAVIAYYDTNIEYVPGGKFYNYITASHAKTDAAIGEQSGYALQLLQFGIGNYFKKQLIPAKNEAKAAAAVTAARKLADLMKDENADAASKRMWMNFYASFGDEQKLIKASNDYVENGLLKMNIQKMRDSAKAAYDRFMQPFITGKEDSVNNENFTFSKRLMQAGDLIELSYNMRDAAETVFFHVENKAAVAKAIGWAKQANAFFPHFSTQAVYAALLYKSADAKQAAAWMNKAATDSFLAGQPDLKGLLMANAGKIGKGEALTEIWHRK